LRWVELRKRDEAAGCRVHTVAAHAEDEVEGRLGETGLIWRREEKVEWIWG